MQHLRLDLRDRARRLVSAVVLVVYAALSVAGSSLVVCAESNGHTAIEWRGADCCSTEPGAPAEDADTSEAAPGPADDCVACTDTPAVDLASPRASDGKRDTSVPRTAEPATAAALVPVEPLRVLPSAPARAAGPRAAPQPPPQLARLRTVVLRC